MQAYSANTVQLFYGTCTRPHFFFEVGTQEFKSLRVWRDEGRMHEGVRYMMNYAIVAVVGLEWLG
jgi:hypothetical protein